MAADAGAAESDPPSLRLQLTAQQVSARTHLQLDESSTGLGTRFGLEDDIGMPRRQAMGAALLSVRLGERWRGELEVSRLSRQVRQHRLDIPLTVDGADYGVGAAVDADFSSTVFKLALSRSLWRSPDADVGLILGLHATRFTIGMGGKNEVGGVPVRLNDAQAHGTAPLPVVGMYGEKRFESGWTATVRAEVFSLSHRGYDGRLIDAQLNAAYRFTSGLSLGAGYRLDDYRLAGSRESFHGLIRYRFQGPQVFAEMAY